MIERLEHFSLRDDKTRDYAHFVVLQRYQEGADSGYFMLAIESSFGTGYAFAWTHPGDYFHRFLQTADADYLCGKFCVGERAEPNWEETTDAIRAELKTRRVDGDLSDDEVAAASPDCTFESESDYTDWCREQNRRASGDSYLEDTHELIAYSPPRRVIEFMALHKAFWPAFCEKLKASDEQRAAARERMTAMSKHVADEVAAVLKASNIRLG